MSGQGPANSAIRTTPELEKLINAATSGAEIQEILHQEAIRQGLFAQAEKDPSILLPTQKALDMEAGLVVQPLTRTITVNGVAHTLEGTDEASLTRAEVELYKHVFANVKTADPTRDAHGRFVADQGKAAEEAAAAEAQNAVAKAEMELKFKRGEISTADYLAQSGAIEEYLGVSAEDLRAAATEKSHQRITNDWVTATTQFMNTPEGRTWPGGEQNKEKMAEILEQMGADPNVTNLKLAYQFMKDNNLLVASEHDVVAERNRRINDARTPEEMKSAVRYGQKPNGTFLGS
jgi:hypothetical protein